MHWWRWRVNYLIHAQELGSALVFKVTLPCMLFVKLVQVNFESIPLMLVLYGLLATTGGFLILELLTRKIEKADRGAFVQASFHSNMGIVGFAYCLNAYGESIIATVSIYLAFITILYNILSLITLTRHGQKDTDKLSMGAMSMPLALLCAGASIRWRDFRVSNNLYYATFAKLIAVPALLVTGGILIGLRGEALGVLYLSLVLLWSQ